jgi:ATP-dependent DNA helicase RecQ
VLQHDVDRGALAADLSAYFQAKEHSEVARSHAMLDFFASAQCLSHRLAGYFGDHQAPLHCGHCSVCQGQVAQLPAPAVLPPLASQNFAALCGELIDRHQGKLRSPASVETLTRFLCGISAPVLTKLKARSLSGFAALEHYPYAEVRQWVQYFTA